MPHRVITPPAVIEPITTDDARLHLRLGDDEIGNDALIAASITAAREYAEHYTGRSLAAKTLEMALDAFPSWGGEIELDMPPVTEVTSIKYDDTAGVEQTLSPSAWRFSDYGEAPRRVTPAYGTCWPSTRCQRNAVRILYTVGASCPQVAKNAILLIVGHLFENRQEVLAGTGLSATQVPMGAMALLDTVKVWGF